MYPLKDDSGSCYRLDPTERFAGAPHAVKDHSELAREGDTRLARTGSSGEGLGPVFQSAGTPDPAQRGGSGKLNTVVS